MFILFLLIFKAWILNIEYLIQIRIKSSRYYITKAASETLAFVFALVNIKVSECKHTALLPKYNCNKVATTPVLHYAVSAHSSRLLHRVESRELVRKLIFLIVA